MGRSVSERSVSERSVSERSVSERNINAPTCESQQKLELRSALCAQLCALSSVRCSGVQPQTRRQRSHNRQEEERTERNDGAVRPKRANPSPRNEQKHLT